MIRWITELLNRWFELPFPASDPAWTPIEASPAAGIVIGRDAEIDQIMRAFTSAWAGPVRIIGPHGIGKTTLMQTVCDLIGTHFPHWVVVTFPLQSLLADLRPARAITLAHSTEDILAATGISLPDSWPREPLSRLRSALIPLRNRCLPPSGWWYGWTMMMRSASYRIAISARSRTWCADGSRPCHPTAAWSSAGTYARWPAACVA